MIELDNGWKLFLSGMKELRSPDRGGFYNTYFFKDIFKISCGIVYGYDLQGNYVTIDLTQ